MGRLLGMSFFFLLFAASPVIGTDVELIDSWQCGPDSIPGVKELTKLIANWCPDAVKDHANMCCIVHDHCYDNNKRTGVSQSFCDEHFCRCFQDASDKTKMYGCQPYLKKMCETVKSFEFVFEKSVYVDHTEEFVNWVDMKPLKFEFKTIFDACTFNKRVVVRCHNLVYTCSTREHEMDKREIRVLSEEEYEEAVKHSFEDCRATAFDCLRKVIDTSDNDQCSALAQKLGEQANPYAELKVVEVGQSIVSAYPVIASRLVSKCKNSAAELRRCYKAFDTCYNTNPLVYPKSREENNAESIVYLYDSPVRRINITCHWGLKACIEQATNLEDTEVCVEARDLAISRIRNMDLEQYGDLWSTPKEVWEWYKRGVKGAWTMAKDKIVAAGEWIGGAAQTVWGWITFW